MLLAAVVLIFAFLALASMVSRVSQLGTTTGQDQDRPVLLEIDTVQKTVDDLILNLQQVTPTLNATSTPTFGQALQDSLRHLAHLERARGFRLAALDGGPFEAAELCAADRVEFLLSDGEVRVQLVSTQPFTC